jgi:hypothetical protein
VNVMFQRCARCLGQLGALHPARIRLSQPAPPSLSQKPFDFLCSAMSHILRILRTAQHLELVELCIYVLHKLMCHPAAGVPLQRSTFLSWNALMLLCDNVPCMCGCS